MAVYNNPARIRNLGLVMHKPYPNTVEWRASAGPEEPPLLARYAHTFHHGSACREQITWSGTSLKITIYAIRSMLMHALVRRRSRQPTANRNRVRQVSVGLDALVPVCTCLDLYALLPYGSIDLYRIHLLDLYGCTLCTTINGVYSVSTPSCNLFQFLGYLPSNTRTSHARGARTFITKCYIWS